MLILYSELKVPEHCEKYQRTLAGFWTVLLSRREDPRFSGRLNLNHQEEDKEISNFIFIPILISRTRTWLSLLFEISMPTHQQQGTARDKTQETKAFDLFLFLIGLWRRKWTGTLDPSAANIFAVKVARSRAPWHRIQHRAEDFSAVAWIAATTHAHGQCFEVFPRPLINVYFIYLTTLYKLHNAAWRQHHTSNIACDVFERCPDEICSMGPTHSVRILTLFLSPYRRITRCFLRPRPFLTYRNFKFWSASHLQLICRYRKCALTLSMLLLLRNLLL